jgi:hypothetical protein
MTTRNRSQIVLALLSASAIGIIVALLAWATPARAANGLNPCGCREGAPGQCICERKSRCGCPGECEPKGCEEKRAKQLEKEIQAETKKAEEAQRRQRVRQEQPEDDSPKRGGGESADQNRGAAERAAPKVKIMKMTAAQKRDLAKLIAAYLAEHPEQGGKAVEQVQAEMRQK